MSGCAGRVGDEIRAPLRIACAADRSYAMPLAVMLHSVDAALATGTDLEVYIIDGGLSQEDRSKVVAGLGNRVRVCWMQPQRSGFERLPLWGRMPVATYDKLRIAEILPPEVERVLWLDCDIVALSDLGGLGQRELKGASVLAVRDAVVPTLGSRFGVKSYRELRLDGSAAYFNAGVLVIDCLGWRRAQIAEVALEYLRRKGREVVFWDQEALNVALADSWGEIEGRWNYNVGVDRLGLARRLSGEPLEDPPVVLHFAGSRKPWTSRCPQAFRAIYYRHLDCTPWASRSRPKRDWRVRLFDVYDGVLRRHLYPAEAWALRLQRLWTFHFTSFRGDRED